MSDSLQADLARARAIVEAATPGPWLVLGGHVVSTEDDRAVVSTYGKRNGAEDAAAIALMGTLSRVLIDLAELSAVLEECDGHLRDDGTHAGWDAGAFLAARSRRTAALAQLRALLAATRETEAQNV